MATSEPGWDATLCSSVAGRLAGSDPLDPTGVARAILSIASGDEHRDATVLGVTADGLEAIGRVGDLGGGK